MNDETQERTFNKLMILCGLIAVLITVSSCGSAIIEAVVKVKLAQSK